MTKLNLNKTVAEITELAQREFQDSKVKELRNVFEEVSYGEITIKVVDGEIEWIRVLKNYKPLIDKSE